MNIYFYLLLVLVLICNSCDCLQVVQGYIVDEKTGLPIEKVSIRNYGDRKSQGYLLELSENENIVPANAAIFSDSNGYYEFTTMAVSMVGCPKIKLIFEKEEYIDVVKEFKSCCIVNDTIKLKLK